MFHTHVSQPLKYATGPTSQHDITISVFNWDSTSEPPLDWTQSKEALFYFLVTVLFYYCVVYVA